MFYFMIVLGLFFAYINGMHDGGTVVATTITSRLISPKKAVFIAGTANLLGALCLGTAVAYTISESIVDITPVLRGGCKLGCTFAAASFLGSMAWNILTFLIKLPSSASHSMIGAMIGSAMAAYGLGYIEWTSVFFKVILAMVISPVLGFIFGYIVLKLQRILLKNATMVWDCRIRILHKLSSFFLAFSYGSNDAQKVMGLITIGLMSRVSSEIEIPFWLIAGCSAALAAGTVTGGYNMIKTIGMDICKIDIQNSFASQISTIGVMTLANLTGLPISATQVITSSVMGVGSGNTPKSVNWSVAKKILLAWLITIPASAAAGYLCFMPLHLI